MAYVHATIGLLTDEVGSRITLEALGNRSYKESGTGTFIQFEGRTGLTGFRGTARPRVWQMEALFNRNETDDAAAFVSLLQTAFDAADGRLVLRPGGKLADLNEVEYVESHEWDVSVQKPAGIISVRFTLTQVHVEV